MKKLFLSACLAGGFLASAQISTSTSAGASRWTFGGGASLGFSGGSAGTGSSVGISPRVGYLLTDQLEAGVSGGVTWSNSRYFSSTMMSVGPFANYYFSRNFFISALFQEYFFNQKNKFDQTKYSGDEAALYLGTGYLQNVGGRLYIQIGAMYNVLYDKNKSIFGNGFVPNIGVVYGL